MKKTKLKIDRFRKRRGGPSRVLVIACAKCHEDQFQYQKDGPGSLKRLYVDRIMPNRGIMTQKLECHHCGALLGVLYIYQKENRQAFRLIPGAATKHIAR